MDRAKHDMSVVQGFFEEQQLIFDMSDQAMYVYLEDNYRMCNEKFAKLLGYKSADEWVMTKTEEGFPKVFVAPQSQRALVNAYQLAMEKMSASTFKVEWKKKSGGAVSTTVVLVPIAYQGHIMALHFVK